MFNKILVPLDGSPVAEAILPYVETLAKCADAKILLLQVNSEAVMEYAFGEPHAVRDANHLNNAEGNEYLTQVKAQLVGKGLRVESLAAEGPVAGTILEIAQDEGADAIAMSTHGRSGWRRLVIGSVADEVVRHATIPVLLVRPPYR